MPNIGDARIRTYQSGDRYRQVFVACVQCGKGRWQVYRTKGTNRPLCCVCAGKKRMENPIFKEKILAGSRRRWAVPGARGEMRKMMSGGNNHFYGKKHTEETREILSRPRVKVNIGHTREWGYLIGVVLGDGCISRTNGGNYKVTVSSTIPEIVDIFYDCVRKLGLHCGYEITTIKPELRAKSKIKSDATIRYTATLLSKKVYCWLRPYKYEDYHFTVPDIVYRHKDMLCGFLKGFFDAEGGIYPTGSNNGYSIECYSKHKSNLEQVKRCLDILGIESYIQVRTDKYLSRLIIANYKDRLFFKDLIGFKIERKADRLNKMGKPRNNTYSQETHEYAEKLISEGVESREIAKLTNVNIQTIGVWRFYLKHPDKKYSKIAH